MGGAPKGDLPSSRHIARGGNRHHIQGFESARDGGYSLSEYIRLDLKSKDTAKLASDSLSTMWVDSNLMCRAKARQAGVQVHHIP